METAAQTKEQDHAYQNASGWAETITELVAALECDYDRLTELIDERQGLVDELADADAGIDKETAQGHIDAWDEDHDAELEELKMAATIDGELCADGENARERIQEGPLSVEVRSPWYTPGADEYSRNPEDFRILLSTGGPALQIRGELSEHGEPTRAWLEYQDWGTPWTEYHGDGCSHDDLLTYCKQFFFGE